MPTIEVPRTTPPKRMKSSAPAKGEALKEMEGQASTRSAPTTSVVSSPQLTTAATKHDRILALLGRRDGATIPEMMEVSGWQQHSVRGFLAGTVKKKLGLPLTSSKVEGELRRYRIATRRGR